MGTLLISLLTLVLLLISVFIVLIILMQRTSQNGGMGAALGGGAAESAFGSETNNILTKGTIYGTIAFFLVSLGLYLLYQGQASSQLIGIDAKALISAEAGDLSGDAVTAVVESSDLDGTNAAVVESVEVQATDFQTEVEATKKAATTETVPVAK